MEAFTKLYNREFELIDNINDLKVYNHIKKVYSYQKKASFDLQSKIEEDTGLQRITVIRSIQRLKDLNLIMSKKKGRYNYYRLPIFDECEGRINKPILFPRVKDVYKKYKEELKECFNLFKKGEIKETEEANNKVIEICRQEGFSQEEFDNFKSYFEYAINNRNNIN